MAADKDLAAQLTGLTEQLSHKINSLTEALSDISEKVRASGSEGGDLHQLVVAAENTAKSVSGDFGELRDQLHS